MGISWLVIQTQNLPSFIPWRLSQEDCLATTWTRFREIYTRERTEIWMQKNVFSFLSDFYKKTKVANYPTHISQSASGECNLHSTPPCSSETNHSLAGTRRCDHLFGFYPVFNLHDRWGSLWINQNISRDWEKLYSLKNISQLTDPNPWKKSN